MCISPTNPVNSARVSHSGSSRVTCVHFEWFCPGHTVIRRLGGAAGPVTGAVFKTVGPASSVGRWVRLPCASAIKFRIRTLGSGTPVIQGP